MNANINEVFLSIQGEGLLLGKRQIFIRFSGCNLRCDFCDTKYAQNKAKECVVFDEKIKNPISPSLLHNIIRKKAPFHSISLTGGEPLLQADFIKEFLYFKEYFVYLDTNGSLPDEFEKIKGLIDLVSMDIKLPSSTKEKPLWKEHKKFLKKISNGFVKMVITNETSKDDFLEGIGIIKDTDFKIPLVIQPDGNVAFDRLFSFQKMALERLSDVRIIPQIHKILGIR
ncbi:MAG: 7-carboxy-7-deazaguanine synthase QueE [bacterium]